MTWTITTIAKPKLTRPIFIEGMPGIGNVGKIGADILIKELKAKKIAEITGYKLPSSVFVGEDNLVALPVIELYYCKTKKQDILILSGDAQPVDEESCYTFCDKVVEHVKSLGVDTIITLAGIGLPEAPIKSMTYTTGTDKKLISELVKAGANPNIREKVGPIIGVSGVLLGIGARKGCKTASLLGETLANPIHAGFEGAKSTLLVLTKYLGVTINYKNIDGEIASRQTLAALESGMQKNSKPSHEMTYIG